jgi:hypothetical protein
MGSTAINKGRVIVYSDRHLSCPLGFFPDFSGCMSRTKISQYTLEKEENFACNGTLVDLRGPMWPRPAASKVKIQILAIMHFRCLCVTFEKLDYAALLELVLKYNQRP